MESTKMELKNMDFKRMTVESLMRQLSLYDKNAEIMITIGDIPIAIPANSMSIRENAERREIVSINVKYEALSDIVDLGTKMIAKKRVVKTKSYTKKIKCIKKGRN